MPSSMGPTMGDTTNPITIFNAADPIYQQHDRFPPDKLEGWDEIFSDHMQVNDIILLNHAQCQEVREMKNSLLHLQQKDERMLDLWIVQSIQTWFSAHYNWTIGRLHASRAYLFPFYETRFRIPATVKEAQDNYENDLHHIELLVNSLDVGADIEPLLHAWCAYERGLDLAVSLMENMVLMLYRSYFTYEDHVDVVKESCFVDKLPAEAIGAVVYYFGMGRFVQGMLTSEMNPPMSCHQGFEQKYLDYVNNIVPHVQALRSGVPPTLEEPCNRKSKRDAILRQLELFNPLDTKYQKDKRYPPNKLKEWEEQSPAHVKDSNCAFFNNAHRREIEDMKEALRRVAERGGPLQDWAVRSITRWWSCHYEWTVSRVQSTRAVFIPEFEKRFFYPMVLKETQDEYIRHLHDINDVVNALKAGDAIWRVYDLIYAWAAYEEAVNVALDLTEPMAIMLQHAYFSQQELANMIKGDYIKKLSKFGVGSFIYHMGKEKAKKKNAENKFSNVKWRFDFAQCYNVYANTVVVHVQALNLGVPPMVEQGNHVGKWLSVAQDSMNRE